MKMKILNYNIVLRPEPEGGFTVLVPSLPGCITYGKNLQEAKEMAADAIKLYLKVLQEDNEPVPSDEGIFTTSIQIISALKLRKQVYA